MPTLGVPWWRRPRDDEPAYLRVRITPHGGAPYLTHATRAPSQDHANGMRVYVCELPPHVFRALPHSTVDIDMLPGMSEVAFVEAQAK